MLALNTRAGFEKTSWTLIDALRSDSEAARRRALDLLVRAYWPPVYAFIRRKGYGQDEAADLTQQFFSDKIIERDLFAAADASRGRLRSLLCACLNNFLISQSSRGRRKMNSAAALSADQIDREESLLSKMRRSGEGDAFDRRWALAMVEEALRRCEDDLQREGRDRQWRVFEARVTQPILRGTEPTPYAALTGQLGFRTPAIAAAALQYVKHRFRQTLNQVVAETVGDEQDAAEECALLREILS